MGGYPMGQPFAGPGLPSQLILFRAELTSIAGIRAMTTAGLALPYVFDVSIGDDDRRFKVRARVSGEVDNGETLLVPDDYNATSNNVIIVRIR